MTNSMLEMAEAVREDAAATEDELIDSAEDTAAASAPVKLNCPE